MIHNRGGLSMMSWSRLDQVALEALPNDGDFCTPTSQLPQMISALGGRTAPSGGGGGVGPQIPAIPGIPDLVLTSRAPDSRQPTNDDGGGMAARPSSTIRQQERQAGVQSATQWKGFDPAQNNPGGGV